MYFLENLHWFLLLVGGLVFFHELGHFVVAKLLGVRVLRFSLGFGPRLFGFVRGDTEYWVSALPLGGYVRMLGEAPGVQVRPEEQHRAFSSKPVWQRAAIASAGPSFNFLLAFLAYVLMFTGTHTFGDTKLGVVSRDGPAWQAGLRAGDKIVAVDEAAVHRWADLRHAVGSRPGDTVQLTFERQGERHTVAIAPEVHEEANVFEEMETRGRIGVSLQFIEPVIAVVDLQSPAATAGLMTGDVVEKVGDIEVAAWHELRRAIHALPASAALRLTIRRGETSRVVEVLPGEPVDGLDRDLFSAADPVGGYTGIVSKDTLVHEVKEGTPAAKIGLVPGDRLLHLAITKPNGEVRQRPIGVWGIDLQAFTGVDARSEFTLTLQRGREVLVRHLELEKREEQDELKNKHTRYVFGATNDSAVLGSYTFERNVGLLEAIVEGAKQVADDTTMIGKGIAMIIRGRLPFNTVGGPIMLFVIAEKSAKRGWEHFMRIMAMISVNLGLLNLLPIPVLDGGHLTFFAIEAVRRRPPSERTREVANFVGIALLLMLMVLVFKNDILRYVLG